MTANCRKLNLTRVCRSLVLGREGRTCVVNRGGKNESDGRTQVHNTRLLYSRWFVKVVQCDDDVECLIHGIHYPLVAHETFHEAVANFVRSRGFTRWQNQRAR